MDTSCGRKLYDQEQGNRFIKQCGDPAAGNTVTVDRTAPAVSSTIPANGSTGVALNSTVTINWSETVTVPQ